MTYYGLTEPVRAAASRFDEVCQMQLLISLEGSIPDQVVRERFEEVERACAGLTDGRARRSLAVRLVKAARARITAAGGWRGMDGLDYARLACVLKVVQWACDPEDEWAASWRPRADRADTA